MTGKHVMLAVAGIGMLLVGGAGGAYFGGQLGAKGGTVLGMCEMAKVAVAQDILDQTQIIVLAEATGRDLQSAYPLIAERLAWTEESMANASASSDCSVFLSHLNKGMESAKK